MKIIASYNLKGGVGQDHGSGEPRLPVITAGHRTLLWDLDPQGAATYLFRVSPRVKGGSPKFVRGRARCWRRSRRTDFEGLDLLPADFTYRHMDIDLNGRPKPQGPCADCSPRSAPSTTWSSWTRRRACRWSRRT